MNKRLYFPMIIVLAMGLVSCTKKSPEKVDIVANINGYNLPLSEFQERVVHTINMEKDFKLTKEAKKDLLEQFIREELLLQEAIKLKLDRKDKFIKAMERYWKATLIRDIMEMKTELFNKIIYVTKEEIETRYKEMKKSKDHLLPMEKLKDKIAKELREEKKRKKLVEWINNLEKHADIKINEDLLFNS